jgi:hypothetical protein
MALSVDDEWSKFLNNNSDYDADEDEDDFKDNDVSNNYNYNDDELFLGNAPEPTNIYISTQTKIAYLEQPIDLNIFWKIPVIAYSTAKNGVIKKQIKINSKTPEDLILIQERLKNEIFYEEHIMSHIDNPNGRIKFKDIRKITIGVSRKDIMSYRSKKKQAFYNCFVMILRINIDSIFREFHIKVFNTGKLEIPGVQSESMFETVLSYIIDILQPYHTNKLLYNQSSDTVLINSNFNCGFFIKRQMLYDILKSKYNIQCIYDPCCPYPGIQCKFYYNNDVDEQFGMQITTEEKNKYKNITVVSFMIFRTGSVLIVGMCNEKIINNIYKFLTEILKNEFKFICQDINVCIVKDKKKKIRKKFIYIDNDETDNNNNNNTAIEYINELNNNNNNNNNNIINIGQVNDADEIKQEVKQEIIKIKEKKPRTKKANKMADVNL